MKWYKPKLERIICKTLEDEIFLTVRGSVDSILEQVGRITGVLGDHTTTLRVMNNTLHFQASVVGDQTESYECFTKEVNEHMKESTGSSRAQREVIEMTNKRVT